MININKRNGNNTLFSIALILFVVLNTTQQSLALHLPLVKYLYIFDALIAAISIGSIRYFSKLENYFAFIAIPAGIYIWYQTGYKCLLPILLTVAATGISYRYILKIVFYSLLVSTALVCLTMYLGMADNLAFERETEFLGSGMSYSMGFYYYSGFSFRCMSLIILYTVLNIESFNLKKTCICLGCTFFVFLISYTRLQLYVNVLLILSAFFINYIRIITYNKIIDVISVAITPIMIIFTFVISVFSVLGSQNYDLVNSLFNGRLAYNVLAFEMYDITMFGNYIEMVGRADAEFLGKEGFYIDSGYVFWILAYGIIMTGIILYSNMSITHKFFKNNKKYLWIVMIVFAFANTTNEFWGSEIFPYTFLLFSDIEEN